MNKEINQVVLQWNRHGIILETQFNFVTRPIVVNYLDEIYQIILENGGTSIEDEEVDIPLPHAIEIKNLGWMIYFFNPDIFELKDSEEYAKRFYLSKFSTL